MRSAVKVATCGHTEGVGHDCEYVTWRDGLVPRAVQLADALVPTAKEGSTYRTSAQTKEWDAAFHGAMRQLTAGGMPAGGMVH